MDKISEELTKVHRWIIRRRDCGDPCIYCKTGYMTKEDEVCHYIDVSKAPGMRWILHNAAMGHRLCNQKAKYDLDLQNNFTANMMDKFGKNQIMFLHMGKNKIAHLSRSDKKELLGKLKNILSKYENA